MSDSHDPRRALEALIFASESPATAAQIRRALHSLAPGRIPDLVSEINEELEKEGRPYWIAEVAGGYQFRTRPEYADVIRAAQPERKVRLSRAALETLAMIAYRQPLTRAEIEDLRCVDCGAILKSLLERALIRIVGRRDAPGRPVLYGTSAQFLETFGLKSLRDLPTLRDVELDEATTGDPGPAAVRGAPDDALLPPALSEMAPSLPSDLPSDFPSDLPSEDSALEDAKSEDSASEDAWSEDGEDADPTELDESRKEIA